MQMRLGQGGQGWSLAPTTPLGLNETSGSGLLCLDCHLDPLWMVTVLVTPSGDDEDGLWEAKVRRLHQLFAG